MRVDDVTGSVWSYSSSAVLDETEPSETRLTKEASDSEWVVSTKLMMMMMVMVMMMMVILQVEVFNVLFTVSGGVGHERKYFVHCMDLSLIHI